MKALEILQEIDDVVINKYHNTKSITFYENDIAFIKEAIAELEELQSRTCKTCKNFYRHDNIQNHGCLKGYSTHVVLGIPCVYVDYGCIRHVPKDTK